MFTVSSAQVTDIVTAIGSTGNAIIGSLVSLAPALLAIAGLRWVFSMIREAVHL